MIGSILVFFAFFHFTIKRPWASWTFKVREVSFGKGNRIIYERRAHRTQLERSIKRGI